MNHKAVLAGLLGGLSRLVVSPIFSPYAWVSMTFLIVAISFPPFFWFFFILSLIIDMLWLVEAIWHFTSGFNRTFQLYLAQQHNQEASLIQAVKFAHEFSLGACLSGLLGGLTHFILPVFCYGVVITGLCALSLVTGPVAPVFLLLASIVFGIGLIHSLYSKTGGYLNSLELYHRQERSPNRDPNTPLSIMNTLKYTFKTEAPQFPPILTLTEEIQALTQPLLPAHVVLNGHNAANVEANLPLIPHVNAQNIPFNIQNPANLAPVFANGYVPPIYQPAPLHPTAAENDARTASIGLNQGPIY